MTTERNGWLHFPTHVPKPGDSRHLCVIVQGDWHYVGVASWVHRQGPDRPGEWWQNASGVDGFVWAFQPLPEGYPVPPNSAQQLDMCMQALDPALIDREAIAKFWSEAPGYTTGRSEYSGNSHG